MATEAPTILLCWHTKSEADVGGMAAEVELSCQKDQELRSSDDSKFLVTTIGIWKLFQIYVDASYPHIIVGKNKLSFVLYMLPLFS